MMMSGVVLLVLLEKKNDLVSYIPLAVHIITAVVHLCRVVNVAASFTQSIYYIEESAALKKGDRWSYAPLMKKKTPPAKLLLVLLAVLFSYLTCASNLFGCMLYPRIRNNESLSSVLCGRVALFLSGVRGGCSNLLVSVVSKIGS